MASASVPDDASQALGTAQVTLRFSVIGSLVRIGKSVLQGFLGFFSGCL